MCKFLYWCLYCLMNYNIIHWEYLQNILQQKSFFLLSLIIDLGLFISAIVGLFVVYKNDKELDATIFSNETETMSINIFNLIQQLKFFSEKRITIKCCKLIQVC